MDKSLALKNVRYAMRTTSSKPDTVSVRCLPEQRGLIDAAAKVLGENRSQFILKAACDKAQNVLLDQVVFRLNQKGFREFNRLLDAPQLLNPGLKRLMNIRAPWERSAGPPARAKPRAQAEAHRKPKTLADKIPYFIGSDTSKAWPADTSERYKDYFSRQRPTRPK